MTLSIERPHPHSLSSIVSSYKGTELQRRYRLKSSANFKRVLLKGHSITNPLLVLVYQSNGSHQTRIGFAAGRSLGNAVARNRVKRRMRATIKMIVPEIKSGWDIILIARQRLINANFDDIVLATRSLLFQSQLLNGNHDD